MKWSACGRRKRNYTQNKVKGRVKWMDKKNNTWEQYGDEDEDKDKDEDEEEEEEDGKVIDDC